MKRLDQADIEYLVLKLPVEARVTLMLGPISMTAPLDVGDCRVCVALSHLCQHSFFGDSCLPAETLFDWHQGWDKAERGEISNSQMGKGAWAYDRCCVIYTAAGWRGPETVILGPHEAIRYAPRQET